MRTCCQSWVGWASQAPPGAEKQTLCGCSSVLLMYPRTLEALFFEAEIPPPELSETTTFDVVGTVAVYFSWIAAATAVISSAGATPAAVDRIYARGRRRAFWETTENPVFCLLSVSRRTNVDSIPISDLRPGPARPAWISGGVSHVQRIYPPWSSSVHLSPPPVLRQCRIA